jgi:hypothetical protein
MENKMTTKELTPEVKHPRALSVQPSESNALMAMIEKAVSDPSFDVAKLQALLAVKEKWEAQEAKKAFDSALAAFKAEAPEVMKSKAVSFGGTSYKHATLDKASAIIGAALSKHGLSHRWSVSQGDGKIRVTTVLTHVLGHSESVTLESESDKSGSKNGIQAIGSAISYLQRYGLFAVTGVASKDQDDDGRASGKPAPAATIPGPEDNWKPATPPASGVELIRLGEKFIGKSKGECVLFNADKSVVICLTEPEARTMKANFKTGETASVKWETRKGAKWATAIDKVPGATDSTEGF